MESSNEEQQSKGGETYQLYGPCDMLEQVIRAFLKCFGHDSTTEKAKHPPSETDTEMKFNEEFAVMSTRSRVPKRPPRPPISSGAGGQINSSSS